MNEVDIPNADTAFACLEGFLGESQHNLEMGQMATEREVTEVRHQLPFMVM